MWPNSADFIRLVVAEYHRHDLSTPRGVAIWSAWLDQHLVMNTDAEAMEKTVALTILLSRTKMVMNTEFMPNFAKNAGLVDKHIDRILSSRHGIPTTGHPEPVERRWWSILKKSDA